MRIALVIAVSIALLPGAPRAHDLRLDRTGDGYVLRNGHAGGWLPIEAARVKAIRCLEGATRRELRASAVVERAALRVRARCDVATALHDGGYTSLTPDGEKPLPRTRAPDAVRSWASRQYAKWVDARSKAAATPVGEGLEIVALGDLARARSGDALTLRVLLDGAPVAGAVVDVDDRVLGTTDRDGAVRVPLEGSGTRCFAATVRRPLATPEAETLVLEATLTFEAGP